jgi:hypothetical protein
MISPNECLKEISYSETPTKKKRRKKHPGTKKGGQRKKKYRPEKPTTPKNEVTHNQNSTHPLPKNMLSPFFNAKASL